VELLQEKQVEKLYADVLLKHKQIDYVFNIAGSFMAGEIRDTPLKNWHYILEEDTFAVVNGTHYAYQAMLTQGSGHIVNMGSSAGLFPVPTMGIYGASKYAIVGLTHALRIEAKALGIKASVICPIIVNTPLYDAAVYNSMDKKRFLKTRHFVQRPQTAAKRILKGVARNKATIHTSVLGQLGWRLVRYTPPLWDLIARGMIGGFRKTLRTK
jgi:short-subunit dehydrogenase